MSKREKTKKEKKKKKKKKKRSRRQDDIDLSFDIVNNVAQEGSRGREGEKPPRARQISSSGGSIPVASCPARRRNVPKKPTSAAPLFRRLRLHFITTARWRRLTRAGVLLDVAEKEHPSAPTCRGRRRDVEVFQGGRRQVFEPLHSEGSSTDRFRINVPTTERLVWSKLENARRKRVATESLPLPPRFP